MVVRMDDEAGWQEVSLNFPRDELYPADLFGGESWSTVPNHANIAYLYEQLFKRPFTRWNSQTYCSFHIRFGSPEEEKTSRNLTESIWWARGVRFPWYLPKYGDHLRTWGESCCRSNSPTSNIKYYTNIVLLCETAP